MRIAIILISFALAACSADPLQPQPELPHWKVLGLGNASCVAFLNRGTLPRERDPYVQWLWGYFTARNAATVNVDRVLGVADLGDPLTDKPIAWLERWCAEHPDAPFQYGAQALLVKEIRDMRVRRMQENAKDRIDMPSPAGE